MTETKRGETIGRTRAKCGAFSLDEPRPCQTWRDTRTGCLIEIQHVGLHCNGCGNRKVRYRTFALQSGTQRRQGARWACLSLFVASASCRRRHKRYFERMKEK